MAAFVGTAGVLKRGRCRYPKTCCAEAERGRELVLQESSTGVDLRQKNATVFADAARQTPVAQEAVRRMQTYYARENADGGGGTCASTLAKNAFSELEGAREEVRSFIGATSAEEIVFSRSATEAINIVAYSWGLSNLRKGDEIVVSMLEHHSNLVPWQIVARMTGAKLKFLPLSANGEVDFRKVAQTITFRTKLLAILHASHVLGSVNNLKSIIDFARCVNVKVLVDACQSLPHMPVNAKQLRCDFLVGSGRKLFAPGVGFLYVKKSILDKMPPFVTGGEAMFDDVSLDDASYFDSSVKFEAGYGPVAQALGLAASIRQLRTIFTECGAEVGKVNPHSRALSRKLLDTFKSNGNLQLYGVGKSSSQDRLPTLAFNVDSLQPNVVAEQLMQRGLFVSAGFHDAIPLHRELKLDKGSVRVSLSVYNSLEDVDILASNLNDVIQHARGA